MFGKKKYYPYVGQENLDELEFQNNISEKIAKPTDVLDWIQRADQKADEDDVFMATFVLSQDAKFYISDRYIDHVQIVQGKEVLSAGEASFFLQDNIISITAITNYSVGYCPEPESWKWVRKYLTKIGFEHPDGFTTEFIYRKCDKCETINVVKDDWYVCAVCDKDLDKQWNIG